MALTPRSVYRDFVVDGVSSSGRNRPNKHEIIQLLEQLFGVSRGGWVVARTLAELNGITPGSETDGGVVLTGSGAGYYERQNGAWVFGRGFPDTFARVELAGTGTAQTGAVATGVVPANVEVFFAFVGVPNTGPMTLTIGGESPREIVNLAGAALAPGEWAGAVIFARDGERYRLLLDAQSALIATQQADRAEAEADRAKGEADRTNGKADEAAASATDAQQSATDALSSKTQAELAALAAGAPFFAEIPNPVVEAPSPFLLSTEAGTQVYTHDGGTATMVGWLGKVSFKTVAALLAWTGTLGPAGTDIEAQGFRCEVAASDATDSHIATAGGVKLRVLPGNDGALNATAFGAHKSKSDNSAALVAMYGASPKAVCFDDFYPVTGNFPRLDIPTHGEGGVIIGGVRIPLNNLISRGPIEVHVATDGSDTDNHGLSVDYPFRTPQRGWDSLPTVIYHQPIMTLSDEVHRENYLSGTTDLTQFPRPAVLFARGKWISPRTQSNSGAMSGGVYIRSRSLDPDLCVLETSAELPYGMYLAEGQVARRGIKIRAGADSVVLDTVHRNTARLHSYDCKLDANGHTVSTMLLAESGSEIEWTGVNWDINGGNVALQAAVAGRIQLSGRPGPGCGVRNNNIAFSGEAGLLSCVRTAAGTEPWFSNSVNGIIGQSPDILIRGTATHPIVVDVPIQSQNARIEAIYTNLEDLVRPFNSDIFLSASAWQRQLTLRGGNLRLSGCNSYTPGNTQNSDAQPIRNEGGTITYAGTNNLVGAGGGRPTLPITTFTATGNGQTLTPSRDVDVYRVSGGSVNRTGCTLGVAAGDFSGRPITVFGETWGVEIVSSATCSVAQPFTIGSGTGHYAMAQFVLSPDGRWVGGPLGSPRP